MPPWARLRHARTALAPDGSVLLVEPFAHDHLDANSNPIGRLFYAASTFVCTPNSLSQEVGLGLGAQAGEARLRHVFEEAGFRRFRPAPESRRGLAGPRGHHGLSYATRLDFRSYRHQQQLSRLRAGARGWLALGVLMPACNSPSNSGLFTPYRPLDAGGGRTLSNAGGSTWDGGSSSSAGDAGLGGSAGSGASSGGGGGAGGFPSGGTGGRDADAGRKDAGLTPDAGADAGQECGGTLFGGICWYLGPLDQSCNQVCSTQGGFNSAATAVVGTPAQGGNIENCAALLTALLGNADDLVVEGTQVAGNGVGCHLFEAQAGSRWWLTTPDFSPAVALVGAQVVCGCNE